MSVALDAVMSGGNGGACQYTAVGGTTITSTGMTVGAGATLLVACLLLNSNVSQATLAAGITWNGVSMTLADMEAGAAESASWWVLINPASGNKTLAASWTGSFAGYLSSISFLGTDTVTGYRSADNVTGYSTATGGQSIVINTGANDATLGCLINNGGTPAATTETQIFSSGAGTPNGAASYGLGGSGTNTHSFNGGGSSSAAAWAGIHILARAAGSGLLLAANQGGF